MDIVAAVFVSIMPLLPLAALVWGLRHGPFRNRWWRGETMLGFAAVVGGACFLLGFVGPLIVTPDANQGPLLGIFITGPAGTLLGLAWGALRAAKRRQASR